MLEVPENAFLELGDLTLAEYAGETKKITHAIEIHENVAIVGLQNPVQFVCSFLADLPINQRLNFSFATGLKITDDGRYTIQFFADEEPGFLQELASRQRRTIFLGSNPNSNARAAMGSFDHC
jgi:hypothetical protein